jgi:general secretion pathway protein J
MDDEMAANKPIAGFTLIEVLLAMGITTFVALLAYSGLSASITAAESQQLQAQQIVDIQLPLTVLERDIRNAVARPIRDEYDDRVEALMGGAFNDYLLVLTRRGWDNPRELSRGELQRVRYQLLDDVLWRESWSVLDRVSEEAGKAYVVLKSLSLTQHRVMLPAVLSVVNGWTNGIYHNDYRQPLKYSLM